MKATQEEFLQRTLDSEKAAEERKRIEYEKESASDSFFMCHHRNCRGLGSFRLTDFLYHLRVRHGFNLDQIEKAVNAERTRRSLDNSNTKLEQLHEEYQEDRRRHNLDRGVIIP
jgi:hypothetical protein